MTIKNFLCLILLQITLGIGLFAQSETKPVPDDEDGVAPMQSGSPSSADEVYTVVDEMPEYPGGTDQLNKDIAKNIKYPLEERTAKIGGNVYVQIIIEKDGSVNLIEVIRGVANGPGLSAAAVEGLRKIQRFKPGKKNGEAVRVKMVVPVKFSV